MRAWILAGLVALPSGLQAQDWIGASEGGRPTGDWSLRLGALVLAGPKYPGSDEGRILPLPLLAAEYRQRLFLGSSRVAVGLGGGVHLWRKDGFSWDVGVGIGERRPESRADALAGMGDRPASLFAGTGLSWRRRGLALGITLAAGLRDQAGLRGALTVGYGQRFGEQWFANLGLSATGGDERNLAYDFGVSPEQAARRAALLAAGDPRLRAGETVAFSPQGGLRELAFTAGLSRTLDPQWRLFVALSGTGLSAEARRSPLVRRDRWASGVLGCSYQF